MDLFDTYTKSKNTIFELTRKQVKTQYRNSSLGFIWTILNPLLNMLIMWFVFSSFFGKNDPYYPLYLLTGNILFAAIRSSTTQALESFVFNRGLLLRTKISLFVFPISNVLTSIVNFLFSLIALIPFMIWLSVSQGINLFSYQALFILLMMPALLLFEYGMGLILAVIYVYFRDLKHLYGVFLTLWMYLTPIFYKPKVIADTSTVVYKIIQINPAYHFVSYFRDCIYRGAAGIDGFGEKVATFLPSWSSLGWCYVSAAAALLIGALIYNLLKKKIIVRI